MKNFLRQIEKNFPKTLEKKRELRYNVSMGILWCVKFSITSRPWIDMQEKNYVRSSQN